MAGTHFIIHATGCLEGLLTTGYEKCVMDAERCSALVAFAGGVDVSVEAQAWDAFAEVEPGSHFLGSAHTLRNFEQAFHRAPLANNGTYEQWQAEGATWQHERANTLWKKMLRDYKPPPFDDGIRDGLTDFIQTRREALGTINTGE